MAPSDFAKANLDEIMEKLTTDEAILLSAGVGFWHTYAIDRLGGPAIKVNPSFLFSRIRHQNPDSSHKSHPRSAMVRTVFGAIISSWVHLRSVFRYVV